MNNRKLMWRLLRIFVILAAIALVVLSLFDFRVQMQHREYDMRLEASRQLARYDASLVESKLQGYLDTFTTAAGFMQQRDLRDKQNIAVLHELEERLHLQAAGLTDTTGNLVTSSGRRTDVSDRMYFIKGMEGRDSVISNVATSRLSDKRMFVLGVPLKNADGSLKGFLHGFMTLDRFQELHDPRLHTDDQSIQVLDRRGEIILRAGKVEAPFSKFDNALETLSHMRTDVSLNEIETAIAAGEDILFEAREHDDSNASVLYFTPLKLNGWYVMSILSRADVVSRVEKLLGDTVYQLVLKVILSVAMIAAVLMLYLRWERNDFLKNEVKLRKELLAGTEGYLVIDLQDDTVVRCTASIVGKYNVGEMAYSQVIKRLIAERVVEKYHDPAKECLMLDNILAEYKRGIRDIRTEYPIVEEGQTIWRECSIHMEHDEATHHLMAYILFKNIDAKKRHEILLTERADNDYLTGLRNRRSAIEQIDHFLEGMRKDSRRTHAFLILDLDHFKALNDTLGHQIGDRALKDVANVLTHHFREYDVISRLGGDEFVVFMKDMPREVIQTNVEALLKKMQLSYEAEGLCVNLTASVGVAFAPMHGGDFETLYHKADRALYTVKERGKNGLHIYENEDE